VVAAAVVEQRTIKALSQITGGTAVSKRIRGGSVMLCEIILNGVSAKVGDYIVADHQAFLVVKKDALEKLYRLDGHLDDNVV
jgi:regulator of RNase E activity RraA